jgi:ribosomal-protein-alanine N-acetyltransferase
LDFFQNKGYGSKLLDYLIDSATKNDIKNITLEVRKDNENAIYLYKKKGFIEKALRKNYYNGIDGVLMEKELI